MEKLIVNLAGLIAELKPEDLPQALKPWFEGGVPLLRGRGGIKLKGDRRGTFAAFAWEEVEGTPHLAVQFGPKEAFSVLRRRSRAALERMLLDLGAFPTREEEAEGIRFLGLRSAPGPSWAQLPEGSWFRLRGTSWSRLDEAARKVRAGKVRPTPGPEPRKVRVARDLAEFLHVVRKVGPSFSWRRAMERDGEALKVYIEWFGSPPPMALAEAVRSRNLEALKVLLENGFPPDLCEWDGTPILHLAVRKNFTEGVLLLLAYGADKEARDRRGRKALEFATNEVVASLLREGGSPETPKELLSLLSEV